jgi:hypothetical protein
VEGMAAVILTVLVYLAMSHYLQRARPLTRRVNTVMEVDHDRPSVPLPAPLRCSVRRNWMPRPLRFAE